MTIPTNSFVSYSAVGNREDLSDIIALVAQEETPFMSSIAGKTRAQGVYHEWQTDTLAGVDTANYQLEGDTLDVGNVTATTRVGNRLQILRKVRYVSRTQNRISKAGRKKELTREMDKAMRELKRDMEAMLVGNQASVTGNSTTARRMGGFETWITTNDVRGSGGSDGGFSTANTVAPTDGTQRDFTEALLKQGLRTCADNGATPKIISLGSFNKQRASGFDGNASRIIDSSMKKVVSTIDVYIGDFGKLRTVWNPRQRDRTCLLIDPEYTNIAYLDEPFMQDLPQTADGEGKAIITELTLEVNNERGHGVVADLTTS